MAPFMSFLLVHYGWRGCNRVVACLCLACTFFGLMMVPVKKNQQLVEHNNNNDVEQEKKKSCLQLLSEIPFLLMVLANIPNAMAIYYYDYNLNIISLGVAAILGPSTAWVVMDWFSLNYSIPFYIASSLFGAWCITARRSALINGYSAF